MLHRIILAIFVCLLTACVKKDVQYYWQHPDKLQAVIAKCPSIQPQGIDCKTLSRVQQSMAALGNELQKNPQDFGKKIILLQENIATMTVQLKKEPENQTLHHAMLVLQTELTQRLAVTRWLESPEG